MREDFLEAIEKMFPNGYVILYPTDNRQDVRIGFHFPDASPACNKLYAAVQLINGPELPPPYDTDPET